MCVHGVVFALDWPSFVHAICSTWRLQVGSTRLHNSTHLILFPKTARKRSWLSPVRPFLSLSLFFHLAFVVRSARIYTLYTIYIHSKKDVLMCNRHIRSGCRCRVQPRSRAFRPTLENYAHNFCRFFSFLFFFLFFLAFPFSWDGQAAPIFIGRDRHCACCSRLCPSSKEPMNNRMQIAFDYQRGQSTGRVVQVMLECITDD